MLGKYWGGVASARFLRRSTEGAVLVASHQEGEREAVRLWALGRRLQVSCCTKVAEVRSRLEATRSTLSLAVLDGSLWRKLQELISRLGSRRLPLLVVCSDPHTGPTAVEVLREGATDHLMRPFLDEELAARLDARLRDHGWPAAPLRVGLNRSQRCLEVADARVKLSCAELAILETLATASAPLAASELVTRALGSHGDGGTVRYHVCQLRHKLSAAGAPDIVATHHGRGYALRADCWLEPGAGASGSSRDESGGSS